MEKLKPVIICVDDEQMILNSLNAQLKNKFGKRFCYEFAESGEEALELIEELIEDGYKIVMLISDQIMPGMTGDQLLINVHQKHPKLVKILLTGQASLNSAINAINNADLYRYVNKPWDKEDFLLTVEKGLQQFYLIDTLERQVRIFGKFVPKQFLEHLSIKDYGDIGNTEAKQTHLSILFSDIRQFTKLSETMAPQEIFELLNQYFVCMDDQIKQNNGFIDKFMGDGIMALFSSSVADSIKAAIGMQHQLNKFHCSCQKIGKQSIKIGIGINTGNLVIGTVGSDERIDSTVVGDAVNIAARMEKLTKLYQANIIISDSTYQALENPNDFKIRELDLVRVYGKEQPIRIYEVFDGDTDTCKQQKEKQLPLFNKAVTLCRQQEWDVAIDLLNKGLEIFPDDAASHFYLERCYKYKKNPPPTDWDGSVIVGKCV